MLPPFLCEHMGRFMSRYHVEKNRPQSVEKSCIFVEYGLKCCKKRNIIKQKNDGKRAKTYMAASAEIRRHVCSV